MQGSSFVPSVMGRDSYTLKDKRRRSQNSKPARGKIFMLRCNRDVIISFVFVGSVIRSLRMFVPMQQLNNVVPHSLCFGISGLFSSSVWGHTLCKSAVVRRSCVQSDEAVYQGKNARKGTVAETCVIKTTIFGYKTCWWPFLLLTFQPIIDNLECVFSLFQIFMHGNNMGTLHEYVHEDILPAELGGSGRFRTFKSKSLRFLGTWKAVADVFLFKYLSPKPNTTMKTNFDLLLDSLGGAQHRCFLTFFVMDAKSGTILHPHCVVFQALRISCNLGRDN